jgi:hypothetical protein
LIQCKYLKILERQLLTLSYFWIFVTLIIN